MTSLVGMLNYTLKDKISYEIILGYECRGMIQVFIGNIKFAISYYLWTEKIFSFIFFQSCIQ